MRQGSRESTRFHASAGGTIAGIVAEGPLGRQKRGSWMVGARNSYLTWPVKRPTDEGVAFAFSDAVAKVVYDATPAQQVTLVGIGGRAAVDWKDEPVTPRSPMASMELRWPASAGASSPAIEPSSASRCR